MTTHWQGQARGDGLTETDDPHEVDCVPCRTMMMIGGFSHLDIEPRPKSMAEAYARLKPAQIRVLQRHARRRGRRRRRR